jgi:hypothetical protein
MRDARGWRIRQISGNIHTLQLVEKMMKHITEN